MTDDPNDPMRGATGATGEQGPPGPKGDPGPAGAIPNVIPVLPPENLVEQTIERAAQKVADGATASNGTPVMSRVESFAVVAVLIVLNLAALFGTISNRADLREHKDDFKAMCEVFVSFAPPEKTADLARQLAECLK